MLKNLIVENCKKNLSKKEYISIINIIKKENPNGIVSSLQNKYLEKYLKKIIVSNKFFLFLCKNKKEIIGYAIITLKPSYLISEFEDLKLNIFFNLFFKLKIIALMNIFLVLFKFDLILIPGKKIKIINENLNLNMLALKKKYQSKHIGSFFLKKMFLQIKKKNLYYKITVETYVEYVFNFYRKNGFVFLGNKLRFFRNFKILVKKL